MITYHNLLLLTKSFEKKLLKARFQKAYSMFKNQIDLVFLCQNEDLKRLVFSTNPSVTCLFLDVERPVRQNNITYFYEQIHHASVSHVQTIENERVFRIDFDNAFSLVFKLYGNKPNLYLFEGQSDTAADSFKNENLLVNKANLFAPKKALYQNVDEIPADSKPKDQLVGLIPTINRQYLKTIVERFGYSKDFIPTIKEIKRQLEQNAVFHVLADGSISTLDQALLPNFETLKSFDEINDAIRWSFLNQTSVKNFSLQKDQLIKLLSSSAKKILASLRQLESPEEAIKRANDYELKAHSLMAYGSQMDWNTLESTVIKLPSTESESDTLTIDIDSKLTAIQNAEKLYAKARYNRSRIKEYELLASSLQDEQRELTDRLQEVEQLTNLHELKDWRKKFKIMLLSLQNVSKQAVGELPYKVLKLGKMEVWVGKNAKSNDELVRSAHKEDIWLHARGVAGSHVLIRMNNHKELPSLDIIEAAAQVAAYYSKLKGSALVPVSYAKKKFVRKPKNALPGLVVMDKEETILVEPKQQLSW